MEILDVLALVVLIGGAIIPILLFAVFGLADMTARHRGRR